MLIDFTVENYRSIKEPVTLSAVAQPSRDSDRPTDSPSRRRIKPDADIALPFSMPGRGLELLPVLAIFGANASGKSNVLRALDTFLSFTANGTSYLSLFQPLDVFTPFRLDKEAAIAPSRFVLRMALEGTVFTYSFAVTETRILEERLEHLPPASKRTVNRLLYERQWNEDQREYTWKNGSDFGKTHAELQKSLLPHEPFLSFLIRRLKVEVTEPLRRWLLFGRWPGVHLGHEAWDYQFAIHSLARMPERQEQVTQILRQFDTNIAGIRIEKQQPFSHEDTDPNYFIYAIHRTADAEVRWSFEEESTGTQRLLLLVFKMLDAFEAGRPLIVDELGSNIHPHITREIVRLFQSTKTNPKRAQLLFTSHDNTLMRNNLLRRDQIWFTQKREDGSTDLYPLSDFRPRNDLAIDRAYLDGRFEAVPVLPDEDEPLLVTAE